MFVQVHVYNSDSEELLFESQSVDTVVDTFGLCSFENPEKALLEMIRICKPEGEVGHVNYSVA